MRVISLSVKAAEEFLKEHGRHYKAPVDPICAIGVAEVHKASGDVAAQIEPNPVVVLHGAAILGRRDQETGELAHIYVDGASQGYSLLYGAVWRAFKALGYDKAVL